jgi:DNA-binding response OmpR family regulator
MATILVVDDEGAIRSILRTTLEQAGYDVEDAANGNEALRLYSQHVPDLIMIDLMMPEKEGLETIKDIRGQGSKAKIIAMSGGIVNKIDSLITARFRGADAIIAKPFDLQGVLKVVRSLLEQT